MATDDGAVPVLLSLLLALATLAWLLLVHLAKSVAVAADPENWPEEEEVKVDDPTYVRHVRENEWPPGINAYDVLDAHRAARGGKPTAHQVPINRVVAIDSELFVGQMVWMARPTHSKTLEKGEYTYKWHFAKKSRTWEVRLQGRFKAVPKGRLFAGVVLGDYDYSLPTDVRTRGLMKLLLPLLEGAIKQRLHLSWGARGTPAATPDAELLCLVAGMSGLDQVVATPAGEAPPPIDSQIDKQGFRRNAMKKKDWQREVGDMCASLSTEKTYTLCLWGVARFVDLFGWSVRIPGRSLSLASFLGPWPGRCVMYAVDGVAEEGQPHRESRKQYIMDLMVLPNAPEQRQMASNIIDRYRFCDARGPTRAPATPPASPSALPSPGGGGVGSWASPTWLSLQPEPATLPPGKPTRAR